jgi:hypothetical protein
METIGAILEQAVVNSFFQKADDGDMKVVVRSHSSDRYKTITEGPGRLVTNVPEAITLGAMTTERGGDPRLDESWETSYRNVCIGEVPEGGFVAYAMYRHSTGCEYVGGNYTVPITGNVPVLEYGSAYARWAEAMEGEAYAFLVSRAEGCTKKVQQSLRFGAGVAHCFAPHDQRRRAWVSALRGLGVKGDVSGIIRSVRTATVKAAITLGWKPTVAKPAYWEGLPSGIVEIPLS